MKLLLAHVLATLFMCGVIWVIQLVHYPLFSGVGTSAYQEYQAAHQVRITWIVLPMMTLELLTAIWLVSARPLLLPAWSLWIGLLLVGVIWLSTAFLQVPLHTRLGSGFDSATHVQLVTTNWIRTVAWSLRAGLVLWWLWWLMPSAETPGI